MHDTNEQKLAANIPTEPAKISRIVYSLFIGFISGGLGMLIKEKVDFGNNDFIVAIIAIGYSGADFIEGVMKNYLNKPDATPKQPVAPSTSQTS